MGWQWGKVDWGLDKLQESKGPLKKEGGSYLLQSSRSGSAGQGEEEEGEWAGGRG